MSLISQYLLIIFRFGFTRKVGHSVIAENDILYEVIQLEYTKYSGGVLSVIIVSIYVLQCFKRLNAQSRMH